MICPIHSWYTFPNWSTNWTDLSVLSMLFLRKSRMCDQIPSWFPTDKSPRWSFICLTMALCISIHVHRICNDDINQRDRCRSVWLTLNCLMLSFTSYETNNDDFIAKLKINVQITGNINLASCAFKTCTLIIIFCS